MAKQDRKTTGLTPDELEAYASAPMASERGRSAEEAKLVRELVTEVIQLRHELEQEIAVREDVEHQLAVDEKHAAGEPCDVCTHLELESLAEALDDAYDRLDVFEAEERARDSAEAFYRSVADAFSELRGQYRNPCGHLKLEKGCGGCDPSAIEFVMEDGSRTLRPYDPATDLSPTAIEEKP